MSEFTMALPEAADFVLHRLEERGYQAYVVGGCVRDSLLGLPPKDYDLCTSATPEEMLEVFADCHVVETGLKHGTLTVVVRHVPCEVTSFRVEGSYSDKRHPDSVTFVRDVREDLSRRDFTVNAMAWNPRTGLVDCFGGADDLRAGVIRCVGDPMARFDEDALRILRALRFAAVYGFAIDPDTERAARTLSPTLSQVSPERIRAELEKLLCGQAAAPILRAYPEVITGILPELAPMVGLPQHCRWHRYDVWEHTCQAVEYAPPEPILRWTMLFHDSGKPACRTTDEAGQDHFYGHPQVSEEIADRCLRQLRTDNATRERAVRLVHWHDAPMTTERRSLTRWLNRLGEEDTRLLIEVHRADMLAHGTEEASSIEAQIKAVRDALDALLAEQPCFSLRDLDIRGGDLIAAGLPSGPALGRTLNALLDAVMAGEVENQRDALLRWAQSHPQ